MGALHVLGKPGFDATKDPGAGFADVEGGE